MSSQTMRRGGGGAGEAPSVPSPASAKMKNDYHLPVVIHSQIGTTTRVAPRAWKGGKRNSGSGLTGTTTRVGGIFSPERTGSSPRMRPGPIPVGSRMVSSCVGKDAHTPCEAERIASQVKKAPGQPRGANPRTSYKTSTPRRGPRPIQVEVFRKSILSPPRKGAMNAITRCSKGT